MTPTIGMETDRRLREHVIDELAWSPEVDHTHIRVSVIDGVVTLSGETDTYVQGLRARNAALCVYGVSVIVNNLIARDSQRSDET
jgi:osmotically-inducible protein OsmY